MGGLKAIYISLNLQITYVVTFQQFKKENAIKQNSLVKAQVRNNT